MQSELTSTQLSLESTSAHNGSSGLHDQWMALALQHDSMQVRAQAYHQVIQECLHSETIFDTCLRYCQTEKDGTEFADIILRTMHQLKTTIGLQTSRIVRYSS